MLNFKLLNLTKLVIVFLLTILLIKFIVNQ